MEGLSTARQDPVPAQPSIPSPALRAVPAAPTAASTARRSKVPHPLRLPAFMKSGFVLGLLASLAVAAVIVVGLGGWRYYWTPLDVRAYTELHPLLRPSGVIGRPLGIVGLSLMLMMHIYTMRKRFRWLAWLGPVTFWLEFHIFCGVLGPVLITLHTSFKFNGIVAVAYWSMVIVLASGYVGRYLYARIPRSIQGSELSRSELEQRAEDLRRRVADIYLPEVFRASIEQFEREEILRSETDTTWPGLLFGELLLRIRLRRLSRTLRHASADRALIGQKLALLAEHAMLLRRIAYLKKTKRLFDLWRVYHKPLAMLMAVIVVMHVVIAWYFGYAFAGG